MTAADPPRRTRFAPASTGPLHLGHVANAMFVWGLARARGGSVLLRIEDHDRQRCRPESEASIIEDLAWLGFVADGGPIRQSDDDTPYAAAADVLRSEGRSYACDCSRATFDQWADQHGRSWRGPGCPGGCRQRDVDGPTLRVALGGGSESWMDDLIGPCSDEVSSAGDPAIRDRHGNWTYLLSVVVDDLRQEIDLVVRGRDLLEATAGQIRLGRLLGRERPPTFAHHRLVRRPDGSKLSKADGATSVRELRAAGATPDDLIGQAALAVGLVEAVQPLRASAIDSLFRT